MALYPELQPKNNHEIKPIIPEGIEGGLGVEGETQAQDNAEKEVTAAREALKTAAAQTVLKPAGSQNVLEGSPVETSGRGQGLDRKGMVEVLNGLLTQGQDAHDVLETLNKRAFGSEETRD